MDVLDQLDLSLFVAWDEVRSGTAQEADASHIHLTGDFSGRFLPNEGVAAEADHVLLEMKSADASHGGEDLRLLLNEMTHELRAQFTAFREMRTLSETLATADDDAAQKLARSDLKAATDAMSLIVRTLEKVDGLQRQLARDRAAQAERLSDETGYQEALHDVQLLIEQRAQELYRKRLREECDDCGEHHGPVGAAAPPPDSG